MSDDLVIDVRGLTKRFGERTVVDHFDIRVPRGAIYGFLGPNGSGKTTTIRMLCGLLTPDEGEGTCLGLDVRRQASRIKDYAARNTGALPVAALRGYGDGAVWVQVAGDHALGWVRGPSGLEHLVPTGGLLSRSILAMDPDGLVDYAAIHVPVVTPVDKKRTEKPPVLEEDVLPPV